MRLNALSGVKWGAANKQTFYLTNMQPQYNRFNAGLWADMEAKVRKLTPSVGAENRH